MKYLNNKINETTNGNIRVYGHADIWNRNFRAKNAKNHILEYGMFAMLGLYIMNAVNVAFNTPDVMQVGTDTATTTSFSMTALVSPLASSSSITYPSSASVTYSQPSETTEYQAVITATWNAGVLPNDTIGELGLYSNHMVFNSTSYNYVITRIAAKDGSFTAFTNNNTYPLAVTYTITFAYQ